MMGWLLCWCGEGGLSSAGVLVTSSVACPPHPSAVECVYPGIVCGLGVHTEGGQGS